MYIGGFNPDGQHGGKRMIYARHDNVMLGDQYMNAPFPWFGGKRFAASRNAAKAVASGCGSRRIV